MIVKEPLNGFILNFLPNIFQVISPILCVYFDNFYDLFSRFYLFFNLIFSPRVSAAGMKHVRFFLMPSNERQTMKDEI